MTKSLLTHILTFTAGMGMAILVLALCATAEPDPPLTDLAYTAPSGPAQTADHLTAKIAPIVQQKLIDAKGDIVENAGGPVARTAVKVGFPVAVREVPVFVDHGTKALLDEFAAYTVQDLVRIIDNHLATKATQPTSAQYRLTTELRTIQGQYR